MKLRLTAPDTLRPRGMVPQPLRLDRGIWATIGAILLTVVDLVPSLPVPDGWKPWMPVIGAILGVLAHALIGPDAYNPVPPPTTPPENL